MVIEEIVVGIVGIVRFTFTYLPTGSFAILLTGTLRWFAMRMATPFLDRVF
jgi:hypothetical protein